MNYGYLNLEERLLAYERLEIAGRTFHVPYPSDFSEELRCYVDREDLLERVLAAWCVCGDLPPMHFRLVGPPGVGKNVLVYRLAQILGKDLYVLNGHEELGPEHVACVPVMTSGQAIEYVASPLFAAMLRGGICFFDEIGKAPAAALDPLASVLDGRRTLTSVLAGVQVKAHPDFLFCAALNENEEEGLGLPGFLDERTRPAIHVGPPPAEHMEQILRRHHPASGELWFKVFLEEYRQEELSPRACLTLFRYAYRLARRQARNLDEDGIREFLALAREKSGAAPDAGAPPEEPKEEFDVDEIFNFRKDGRVH